MLGIDSEEFCHEIFCVQLSYFPPLFAWWKKVRSKPVVDHFVCAATFSSQLICRALFVICECTSLLPNFGPGRGRTVYLHSGTWGQRKGASANLKKPWDCCNPLQLMRRCKKTSQNLLSQAARWIDSIILRLFSSQLANEASVQKCWRDYNHTVNLREWTESATFLDLNKQIHTYCH